MPLASLSRQSLNFPPLEHALREPDGLLALGGDLSPERLISAYRHGCFPWFQDGQPILWWSPDPRMVLLPAELHVSRSLRKTLRQGRFAVSFDRDFPAVIRACAEPRTYADSTWITPAMHAAYLELHRRGLAHSVEVWQDDRLVGGLYGLSIGRLFFGESMFSRTTDASKIGFVTLVERLRDCGFALIDCQMYTRHLASFGARPIPRHEFATCLKRHLDQAGPTPWAERSA
ncbi:leucyl/phenylalanyl-tRNA--protein transferase [Pseudomonas sp. AN-1]|uniref:leucyl/phenylalanyl-tRNA--protein transferase n=1 Tax=Pseudomonas sp. AN-1 TaxID=3096605 RepID=UPI002A6A7231|nr:leucyl/phenylalanyl-tRNA--protein transferase [Pseudomonas sp. AN-1]WPP47255.1 leucyl/phenylalanyl-tRNA--protein transferase [Pseudomonas sp. AN-1]